MENISISWDHLVASVGLPWVKEAGRDFLIKVLFICIKCKTCVDCQKRVFLKLPCKPDNLIPTKYRLEIPFSLFEGFS